MNQDTHLARFPDGTVREVEFGKGPYDEPMEEEEDAS